MTTAAKNSIISIGDTYRLYGSSVQTHDSLPVATYVVDFDPMSGPSLRRVENLTAGTSKIYGARAEKVEKVMQNYRTSQRGLGVMLSGDKGQGKSLFLRLLAEQAIAEGVPVIRVVRNFPGVSDFLDELDSCLIVFDEFEKVFPDTNADEEDQQAQFLSLFDGTSSTKRMYCITVNSLGRLNNYLINRPGRFHYHMRFDYPGADAVREYLSDQAPSADKEKVDAAVVFSRKINLNYDHLRAIAYEMEHYPQESFGSIIEDLNIKSIDRTSYSISIELNTGRVLKTVEALNLFDTTGHGAMISIMDPELGRVWIHIDPSRAVEDLDTGDLILPADAINSADGMNDDAEPLVFRGARLATTGQNSLTFNMS